jgi:hypothetical protein
MQMRHAACPGACSIAALTGCRQSARAGTRGRTGPKDRAGGGAAAPGRARARGARAQSHGARRQPRGQLLGHGADAGGRQAVGARGQAAHDELEQPRAGAQVRIEEDAAQERAEEAVDDRFGETLRLRRARALSPGTAHSPLPRP